MLAGDGKYFQKDRTIIMYERYLKYHLTQIFAIIAIVILSPLLLIITIAIKAEDPRGPVLFRQKRVGYRKQYFQILKFRTMRTDAPHDVPTHLMNTDEYITKCGRFLRKHSLDELPQLFNMIRTIQVEEKDGTTRRVPEMCFVGPRPALWSQDDLIRERDKYGANDVVPGLTGYAQIHGRDELKIEEKARLDGYYVKHLGFRMDLSVLLGSVTEVFSGDRVVEGGADS